MSVASIGGIPFRINPSQVKISYSVDTNVTPTVGGRVVQILGATLDDVVIQGLYGQDHKTGKESGQIAEDFQQKIANLIVKQSKRPTFAQLAGTDSTPMHPTHRFYYNDTASAKASGLPSHEWDMQVYIKSFNDINDPGYTVAHRTGKYSYGYELRLSVVEDSTKRLETVAQNQFLARLANGVGWKQTAYNGPTSVEELSKWLETNSPDQTIHGLVLQEFQAAGQGQVRQRQSSNKNDQGGGK